MSTPQEPRDPFGGGPDQGAGGPAPDPGQGGYGSPGYGPPGGAPGYGAPQGYPAPGGYGGAASPFGQPGGPQLATWAERAQGALIDWFGPALLAGVINAVIGGAIGLLAQLAALAWAIYNAYLQGGTGQSYGKKQAGLRLLREQDGQVIGAGLGIGRYFLHILDALPCYVGFLWPLWDDKKQTFADKIVKSVVVKG